MDDSESKKVFRIVTGKNENSTIKWPVQVGEAIQFSGADYYLVKFNMLPEQRYYLKKNENSQVDYTVYSDITDDGTQRKFLCPCAFGTVSSDLKTFLTLTFPFPGSRVYVDLIPKND